jgi:hypothetical protein
MSANMLFFASFSRSPIKFFAFLAGFTSLSNTARASAPVRRLGGATPTAASGLAEEDFFEVVCPASLEVFASEAVFDSSSASTCAYQSSSFCCLVRCLLGRVGLGARVLRVREVRLLRIRERGGGRLAGREGGADGGAREEHQTEHHERQEPRREDHRRGGELVLLALLAVEETCWRVGGWGG